MRVVSTNIRMVDSWPFMKSLKFQLDSLNFFWNGFVYPKIRNPKFDSAMVFEKKKIRLQFWFQKLDSILLQSNLV
jgi:hypothetical protein